MGLLICLGTNDEDENLLVDAGTVRIRQWTTIQSRANQVAIDLSSFYTFKLGMYYSFVGLVFNFRISTIFVEYLLN